MVSGKSMDGAEAARIMYGNQGGAMSDVTKELTRPWQKDEVKWRVGPLNKDKTKTIPLAYIDARTVMERLDKIAGVANWQDRYEFHGARTICYLSIRINDEWICKSDGAGDSEMEGEKGAISDAFKRAAVKWGMGRELYELKCKWMPIDQYKHLVGDPWRFVIKSGESEPDKFDIEEEYNLCVKQIIHTPNKAEFITLWNSQESKNRRSKIKELREDYYFELTAKMKEKLEALNG